MPLLVIEICPSRNALLLLGSSQESVPGDEGAVELLGVLERLDRLRAVDHHLAGLVDHLAAEGPHQPVAPGVGVAGGVAEREAARRALGVQRLHHLQEAVGVLREAVEARRLHVALAVDHHAAGRAERYADPVLAVGAQVGCARVIPAAVFLAEVVGDVGDVDQLLRVQVGVVVGAQDDVGPGAGVRCDRRLRTHVFPAFVVDAHLDAVLGGERRHVLHVLVDVACTKRLQRSTRSRAPFSGGCSTAHARPSPRSSGTSRPRRRSLLPSVSPCVCCS